MITIDIDFDAIRDKFVTVVGDFMDAGLDFLDKAEEAFENVSTDDEPKYVFDFESYGFDAPELTPNWFAQAKRAFNGKAI